MAKINVTDLGIDFPVYDVRARSFRNALLDASVGSVLKRSSKDVVYVNALNDISFDLKAGDRLGLIGGNGSGKSTLLRCLAGVYEPVRGSVDVTGTLASLFDLSLGIDPELTGYDNIYVRGMYAGLARSEIDKRVDEIAEFTELGDFLNLPLRTYSSGMQLRLAFAVSTSFDADVLLIDEIIGVGDAHFAERSSARLKDRIGEAGILVLASHSEEILHEYCNMGLWLESGTVRAFGSLDEVLAAYRSDE